METGSRGSKRIHVNVSYFSTSVRRLPHLPEVPHLHVKRPLKQTTLQLYLIWHRRILPLNQPRPPEQSTRLPLSLRQHHWRRKKHNTCKTYDPYAQTTTLAEEGRYNIWRHNGQLRRCRTMRASRKFPSFPTAKNQHQHRTWQRRQTGHFKHHTERHSKKQKRNMLHLQSQWTTYHHRSQQTDHQFLRRHFQPEQKHLPAFHKVLHNTTIRPPREQPPTNHHKEHAPRHQQKTVIPFIRQSILRPSRSSISKSIRLLRVPVHSTLRTNKRKNRQRNILWYNPPFSKNISTNIGHRFLALVD